jgi:regulator of replication initiation timing
MRRQYERKTQSRPDKAIEMTPNHPTAGKRHDDIVIIVVMAITLVTPILLVVWWTVEGRLFPPMLISVLFGIAIATLTYRYLGGTEKSEFSVGALKLAGSAAMLLGTTWLTNHGLSTQMTLELKPNRISELEQQLDVLRKRQSSLEGGQHTLREENAEKLRQAHAENSRLKQRMDEQERESARRIVAQVAALTPDDDAGKDILDLYRKKQGPFSIQKRSFDTKVRVVDKPRDADAFFACADLQLEAENVQLARLLDGSVDPVAITAKQQGLISDLFCNPKTGVREYSIQISCEGGKTLFPDQVSGCGQDGRALWISDKRNFDVRVEVLSDLP